MHIHTLALLVVMKRYILEAVYDKTSEVELVVQLDGITKIGMLLQDIMSMLTTVLNIITEKDLLGIHQSGREWQKFTTWQ